MAGDQYKEGMSMVGFRSAVQRKADDKKMDKMMKKMPPKKPSEMPKKPSMMPRTMPAMDKDDLRKMMP